MSIQWPLPGLSTGSHSHPGTCGIFLVLCETWEPRSLLTCSVGCTEGQDSSYPQDSYDNLTPHTYSKLP